MTHTWNDLRDIMRALRTPGTGCPWDLEQNFATIAPYTIEEAYEVAQAIAENNMGELKDELGDLLFQVLFHSQIAEEQNAFTLDDVIEAICAKMLRRHPHVFGDATIETAAAQIENWEVIKQAERVAKGVADVAQIRTLANVPVALPALLRSQKLQSRAARVGFDWPDISGVLAKIREELAEVEDALAANHPDHIAEEIGDLLFAVTSLARFTGHDAETALRAANQKFTRRFEQVEDAMRAQSIALEDAGLARLEAAWQHAKLLE